MFSQSGLQGRMQQLHQTTGIPYVIYGDSAYARSQYVQHAYKGVMTAAQRAHNLAMAPVRVTVEWSFAVQMHNWGYLRDKHHLKLREQPLTKLYFAAAILHNLHTLQYKGNLISEYFKCDPVRDRRTPIPGTVPPQYPLMTMYRYLH